MIGIAGTAPINGNRGRATLQCVWSIHRIDAQLGRYLDINSAWRDPQEQERLYSAYRAYVNGNGPWAPIALTPEQSVHCKGEAIDTDDNNASMTRILNDNGWFHTVFRNGVLVEPWHYEYDYKRDKFFGAIPAGTGTTTPVEPEKPKPRGGKMVIYVRNSSNGVVTAIPEGGKTYDFPDPEAYNRHRATIATINGQRETTGQPLVTLPPVLEGDVKVRIVTTDPTRINDMIFAQGAWSGTSPKG